MLRVKRLVVRGDVRFTEKARLELEGDALEPEDALEAILSAPVIHSTPIPIFDEIDARRAALRHRGVNFTGIAVYTKGTIRREQRRDVFYILVSSKRSTP